MEPIFDNKRKFDEGEMPMAKIARTENFQSAASKIHDIADLSGAELRSDKTIQEISELVKIILQHDNRPQNLINDLNSIRFRMDLQDSVQVMVASEISQITESNFTLKIFSQDIGLTDNKILVSSLYGSKAISIVEANLNSLFFERSKYTRSRDSTGKVLAFSEKLTAKLDDNALEVIFQNTDVATLKEVKYVNLPLDNVMNMLMGVTHLELPLAKFPRLGDRAIGLFLKHCPNLKTHIFTNLPPHLTNQKIYTNDPESEFVSVNRELLMACSEYFRNMWSHNFKESNKDEKTAIAHDGFSFQASIDLAITGKFSDWYKQYENYLDVNFLNNVVDCLDYYVIEGAQKKIDQLIADYIRKEHESISANPKSEDLQSIDALLSRFTCPEAQIMNELLANQIKEKSFNNLSDSVKFFVEKYSGEKVKEAFLASIPYEVRHQPITFDNNLLRPMFKNRYDKTKKQLAKKLELQAAQAAQVAASPVKSKPQFSFGGNH